MPNGTTEKSSLADPILDVQLVELLGAYDDDLIGRQSSENRSILRKTAVFPLRNSYEGRGRGRYGRPLPAAAYLSKPRRSPLI